MKETIDTLTQELRNAASAYRKNLKAIGELLLRLEKAGAPLRQIIDEVLCREYGIPKSTAQVAYRWAAGELDGEKTAVALVSKAPHSVLKDIPSDTLGKMVKGEHPVYVKAQGRVVSMRFDQMDADIVADNISVRGWQPLKEAIYRQPEYRSCIASRVDVTDDGTIELVSRGRQEIHMRVPDKLLSQLVEKHCQPA